MEAVIEARKIQKLGSSSLIVTLPRNWVKRNRIKQGDIVYIIDEGRSIRILPASSGDGSRITLDLSKLKDSRMSAMTVSCIYVLGYDEVDLVLSRNSDILSTLSNIKSVANRLLGLDIVDHDEDSIRVRVVIDQTRLDVKTTIKSMTNTVSLALEVLERAAKGYEARPNILEKATYIRNELFKNQHLIIRLIISNGYIITGGRSEFVHGTLIGTSLLAIIGETILDAIYKIVKHNYLISRKTIEYISQLKTLILLVGFILSTPSMKRSREALQQIIALREEVNHSLSNAKEPGDIILLTKIDDVLRVAQIIVYTSFCAATSGLIKG